MSNSFVVYRGPSMLDGSPIVGIAVPKSVNRKTGDMVQIHILRDDMHPTQALQTGADSAICGDCPLRGDGTGKQRACYVVVSQGPAMAWKGHDKRALEMEEVLDRLTGCDVRFGAYGDPAALPYSLVRDIADVAWMWTGYTHQYDVISRAWQQIVMASADSLELAERLWREGWRTYRVTDDGPVAGREITCPNTTRGVQCKDCGLCDGTRFGMRGSTKSIVIEGHGNGRRFLAGTR